MGRVLAVCISEKRGTQKKNIHHARLIPHWGIEGDAHGGRWHRQVSLLSAERINDFKNRGAVIEDGAFGENLIVEGFDFKQFPVGTVFACGDVLLEMTQIGKECHTHCRIYQVMGDCIMPREGVFARVLRGGEISEGDEMTVVSRAKLSAAISPSDEEKSGSGLSAAVITVSDKGYAGQRQDTGGPLAAGILADHGYTIRYAAVVPDEQTEIEAALKLCADVRNIDLIVTTGGTGFSVRDVTPEATCAVCTRMAPGIAEAMRAASMKVTNKGMLSRAASGIRAKSLIINLPGSPKAVRENLEAVIEPLAHGIRILKGTEGECGHSDEHGKE